MDTYTPRIVQQGQEEALAEVLVAVERCKYCRAWMLPNMEDKGIFPLYRPINFSAQLKAAGWKVAASSRFDSQRYCIECAANDKITFTCCLCNQTKPSSHLKERFGDPPDFLCNECFNTIPAAVWEKKVDELQKEHRWDYE